MQGGSDLTATWTKIMNQGFQRGRPIIVCSTGSSEETRPQKFNVFGPKILSSRKRFDDNALESRCLTVMMQQRTRDDIPLNLPREEFDLQALALRNMLLLWRFHRLHEVKLDPNLAVEGIEDRLNQIGIPLLSTVQDESVRAKMVELLRASQAAIVASKSQTWAAFIIRYLKEQWKRDNGRGVFLKDIAQKLNAQMAAEKGVPVDRLRGSVTSKGLGTIVRDELGLKTVRASTGYYYVVRNRGRLAELAKRYGVESGGATPSGEVRKSEIEASPTPKPLINKDVGEESDFRTLDGGVPDKCSDLRDEDGSGSDGGSPSPTVDDGSEANAAGSAGRKEVALSEELLSVVKQCEEAYKKAEPLKPPESREPGDDGD